MKNRLAVAVAVVAVAVVMAAGIAQAKKVTIFNPNKGDMFNDVNNCEQSLTEENAAKKGEMTMKLVMKKGWFWAGMQNPKKNWGGADTVKLYVFNASKKPVALQFIIKFNSLACKFDDCWNRKFMLKPGANNVELELLGECNNGGNPIDWKTKQAIWSLGEEILEDNTTLYLGEVYLDSEDKKEEKK